MRNNKPCSRGCGAMIYFDAKHPEGLSPKGNWIPIDAATNEPHKCPNFSPSGQGFGGGEQQQRQQQSAQQPQQQEGVIQRLERMESKVDSILSHLNLNKKLQEAEQQFDLEKEDRTSW